MRSDAAQLNPWRPEFPALGTDVVALIQGGGAFTLEWVLLLMVAVGKPRIQLLNSNGVLERVQAYVLPRIWLNPGSRCLRKEFTEFW